MSDIALEQVVELALKLTISEQAKLLERVAAHIALEVDAPIQTADEHLDWTEEELAELLKHGTPKTGAEIAALLTSGAFNTNAWEQMLNPDITDSVEWVKALRRDASKQRKLDWNGE